MKVNGKRYNRLHAGDLYELGQTEQATMRQASKNRLRQRLQMAIRKNEWLSDYFSE